MQDWIKIERTVKVIASRDTIGQSTAYECMKERFLRVNNKQHSFDIFLKHKTLFVDLNKNLDLNDKI